MFLNYFEDCNIIIFRDNRGRHEILTVVRSRTFPIYGAFNTGALIWNRDQFAHARQTDKRPRFSGDSIIGQIRKGVRLSKMTIAEN